MSKFLEPGELPHSWDDDAVCIYCGHDGAESHWLVSQHRAVKEKSDVYCERRTQVARAKQATNY